ncbi:MAG TPA: DUF222 domain-containing protein [Mycobacteriales bacterium]|nr:DUF222 domain-containing protein [Mycobacteriales bacterium]
MSGLGSALDELAATDLTDLPLAAARDLLVDLVGQQARLDAQVTRLVGHLDRHGLAQAEAATSTGAWLVGVARMGHGDAHGRVHAARALHAGELPGTAAAFLDGRIGFGHVRAMLAATDGLDPALVAEAEPVLLDAAERLDPGRLRLVTERFRATVDARRHARERADRDEARTLFASRTLGGMVAVRGLLTPLVGEALLVALDAVSAPAGPEDVRTAAQRRHDGLYDLLRAALDASALPDSGGSKPQIVVHVNVDTFAAARRFGRGSLAADAVAAAPLPGLEPATFEHTGEIVDLTTLARLAHDAAIARLLYRGQTLPLDLGRTVRTATPAQKRALAARDRGCVICGRPPRWCDAHHLVAWEDGGLTDLDNLVLLCRYHHHLLDRGWTLTGTPGSAWTLWNPAGTPVRAPPVAMLS